MSECAEIYLNIPKSAWMSFVLHFPIVIPWLLGYLFQQIFQSEETWACFLRETKFNFFDLSFVLLNNFTSEILNSLLPLETEGTGTWKRGQWILIYPEHAYYVCKIILKSVANFKVVNCCKFRCKYLIYVFPEIGACLQIKCSAYYHWL